MSKLRVRLLGEFRLTYSGEPLTGFNSARAQSLLAFLLINRAAIWHFYFGRILPNPKRSPTCVRYCTDYELRCQMT